MGGNVQPIEQLTGIGHGIVQRVKQVVKKDCPQRHLSARLPKVTYKMKARGEMPRVLRICLPGMAQFLRVKVPPQVVTAKCSEPQAAVSNDRRGGSGVAKPRSLRTETGYKAKRWARVQINPKPKG